jgi:peptide chain release factor 1
LALDTHAGHQSVALEIEGKGAEQLINESGAIRLQRIPPTENRGRVHSSTVTVAVLDQIAVSSEFDRRSEDDFTIQWYSGSGAGGQNRNKVQCCVRMTHVPTGIVRTSQTRSRQNSFDNAMAEISQELDRLSGKNIDTITNDLRRNQVGSGERSDKRRTIRFQDDMVKDHITGKSMTATDFMKGKMDRMW